MKILMLTPYLPYPPASGGQIRTLNLLKYLSQNHEVTLICLYKHEKEKQYAEPLKKYCKSIYLCKRAETPWRLDIILKSILTASPLLIVRNFSSEAQELLKNLLKKEQFDVIHAETFYIMPHIPPTNIPVLLVEQTIEFQVYQHFVNNLPFFLRPLFSFDIMKLRRSEKYYWKKARVVAAVSKLDKQMIERIEPSIKAVIVPNGAGDEMFVDTLYPRSMIKPKLLFVGNFYWLQNIEAAQYIIDKIAPLLKQSMKSYELIIAGQEARRINKVKDKNVKIFTIQPEDNQTIKKLYKKSTLFIAPIFGPGGTRLKILAAMASGLPVISTQTGVEGLQVTNQKEILIAENAPEFIQQIKNILRSHSQYEKLRKNAFKHAREKYSWSSIAKDLEIVYRSIRRNN